MPAILPTNTDQQRHVLGDLVAHFYTFSGTNGDTFTPPAGTKVLQVVCTPTTAIDVGVTVSAANLITFVTAGAFAARVMILARTG
jgi:hypothetical protein